MNFLYTILNPLRYIQPPQGWIGWVVWISELGLILLSLYHWKHFNKAWTRNRLLTFLGLLVLTPFTSLFVAISLNSGIELAPTGIPLDMVGINAPIFSAIPWMLAGGLLGPLPAAVLGLFSGILQAFWDTHSPYTFMNTTLLAILFSILICQRYRTWIFRIFRQPVITALFLGLIYPVIYLVSTPFFVDGPLIIQIDYAIDHLPSAWLAASLVLIFGGIVTQVVAIFLPGEWDSKGALIPSPAEKSLQVRFLFTMAPIAILLVMTLIFGSWYVAGAAARDLMRDQMSTITNSAASQVPFYIQSGQNLLSQLSSDPRLASTPPEQLDGLLEKLIKTVPFFTQLVVLDNQGNFIEAYPHNMYTGQQLPYKEQLGWQLALIGTPNQFFTIQPIEDGAAAQTSFMNYVKNETGGIQRVLIGRTDLSENPIAGSIILSLGEMENLNGQGILLDENGQILYHPDRAMIAADYSGDQNPDTIFSEDTALDGSRQFIYYQPVKGVPWAVIAIAPARQAQQLALKIAAPLLGMIVILSLISLIVFSLGLRIVTSSLESLAVEAEDIAKGKLDQPLPVEGVDEVGQLRKSFEKMRASLKARLDELNRLLQVSAGVASKLEITDAVQPVLESALAYGAVSTSVVLIPSVVPEFDGPTYTPVNYSLGPAKDLYRHLDDRILEYTRQHGRLIMPGIKTPLWTGNDPNHPFPASLIAIPLRHENQYYGALWTAYDQSHAFTEEEIRFLSTLASQTATAASNSHLFLSAEIGRQRLEAILASSPDPVLVTDQNNTLILANPAAWQLFDLSIGAETGQPIEQVIRQPELLELFLEPINSNRSAEVRIKSDKVFLAAVSSVVAEGRQVGKVCLLRDVTQFKELDSLKSEFVSTVSHDLRTPITLVRGYATMLEMVGQLNEQQASYQKKIISGMDNMSRLVNNLLDLGRIDAGISLKTESVSTEKIIQDVIDDVRLQAIQKKIKIKTDDPTQESDLKIDADPALLHQALYNLLDNAIKYTKSDGKITVRVQPQTERIIFIVNDTGIGISPMDQPRIFERFYRGPQSANQPNSGSGLGLAIVRSIAERHCGQVWVESQLGRGSTFYLAIPRKQADSTQ